MNEKFLSPPEIKIVPPIIFNRTRLTGSPGPVIIYKSLGSICGYVTLYSNSVKSFPFSQGPFPKGLLSHTHQ